MLLETYTKEIFHPECNSSFQTYNCIAHLDQDVGAALPYLNAELGGHTYTREPPSVTFKVHGKLLTVHARKIAVNALADEAEADRVLEWMRAQINDVWARRDEITPSEEDAPVPNLVEVLRLLPRTNCGECGQPTCMVFASQLIAGGREPEECRPIDPEALAALTRLIPQDK